MKKDFLLLLVIVFFFTDGHSEEATLREVKEDSGVLNITSFKTNPFNPYKHPISYPNPFRLSKFSKITITMPMEAEGFIDTVRIYTIAGMLVREISGDNGYKVEWDGKNSFGNMCVPGIYFYSITTTEDAGYAGKITILD